MRNRRCIAEGTKGPNTYTTHGYRAPTLSKPTQMFTHPSAPAMHAPSHAISVSGGAGTPCMSAYARFGFFASGSGNKSGSRAVRNAKSVCIEPNKIALQSVDRDDDAEWAAACREQEDTPSSSTGGARSCNTGPSGRYTRTGTLRTLAAPSLSGTVLEPGSADGGRVWRDVDVGGGGGDVERLGVVVGVILDATRQNSSKLSKGCVL